MWKTNFAQNNRTLHKYGHKDFYIALIYKGKMIKDYFKKESLEDIKIHLIDTGKNTMTGELKDLKNFLIVLFYLLMVMVYLILI